MDAAGADDAALERSAYRKASLHILPLLALGYGAAYIDRVNISFASLQMNQDLNFSATVYGLGVGRPETSTFRSLPSLPHRKSNRQLLTRSSLIHTTAFGNTGGPPRPEGGDPIFVERLLVELITSGCGTEWTRRALQVLVDSTAPQIVEDKSRNAEQNRGTQRHE
jgi:hypothetical protein